MAEYIERETAIERIEKLFQLQAATARAIVEAIPAADVVPVPDGGTGEISDGYHTFNGLYRQRLILTAALVKAHKDISWKSHRHEDGELCFGGGWFIVGFDTPDGGYTYHYEDKDWDLFECVELPCGKHWDGHTEDDVERLLSIPAADVAPVRRGRWEPLIADAGTQERDEWYVPIFICPLCNDKMIGKSNFCPNCGAKMEVDA